MERLNTENLKKLVRMTGARAKIDAQANDSYIVYNSSKGIVKEYADGKIVVIDQGNK